MAVMQSPESQDSCSFVTDRELAELRSMLAGMQEVRRGGGGGDGEGRGGEGIGLGDLEGPVVAVSW